MTAREFLTRPARLQREIEMKQHRIDFLRRLSTAVSTPQREISIQATPDPTRIQAFLAEAADEEKEVRRLKEAWQQALAEVGLAISLLPDERMIELLELKYLEEYTWSEIVLRVNICRSRVFRLHQAALEWLDRLPEIRNAE